MTTSAVIFATLPYLIAFFVATALAVYALRGGPR